MKYLKITFVRICISFVASNMLISLLLKEGSPDKAPLLYRLILAVVLYYGLTGYVNNRKDRI